MLTAKLIGPHLVGLSVPGDHYFQIFFFKSKACLSLFQIFKNALKINNRKKNIRTSFTLNCNGCPHAAEDIFWNHINFKIIFSFNKSEHFSQISVKNVNDESYVCLIVGKMELTLEWRLLNTSLISVFVPGSAVMKSLCSMGLR